jgi:opacity protein-like surface antigen
MKKNILIFFFLFFIYSLQSQVLIALVLGEKLNTGDIEFGLDGGINYSSISGMESNNSLNSFNLGFYFDFKLKNQWYFNTGVLVKSSLGIEELTADDLQFLQATIYDTEGDYRQKMSYFLVPALAKYRFKNNIYVEAGPQFGLMHKAWIEFNSKIEGNTARIKQDNKDMINRFDMGVTAGTGYRLLKGLGWTIGVRYYYGFLNVYKDRSGTRNSSLFLKLNMPVGVSERTKEKIEEQKALKKEKKRKRKQGKQKL